jgi:hypothetical protein
MNVRSCQCGELGDVSLHSEEWANALPTAFWVYAKPPHEVEKRDDVDRSGRNQGNCEISKEVLHVGPNDTRVQWDAGGDSHRHPREKALTRDKVYTPDVILQYTT